MKKISTILKQCAKNYDKYNLAKNTYAVNKEGDSLHSSDKKAVAFCSVGMINRTTEDGDISVFTFLNNFCLKNKKKQLVTWNDAKCRTKAEVQQLFLDAAKEAKAQNL